LPKDFPGNQEAYLQMILLELVPHIKQYNLCKRFDIFIEDNAFGTEISGNYLMALKALGFDVTVHGDQFSTGGSKVAVDVGAISVDHLEVTGDKEIAYLAKSNTIATALPGASLGIGCAFTPARKLLDAGCTLAIASDWNPGSAPMGDLLTQASILAAYEKLSTAETLGAMTYRAAAALNLQDRGRLTKGMKADFIAFPTNDYRDILYHQGMMLPQKVWIDGKTMI
jgi:imidazolonepropionase